MTGRILAALSVLLLLGASLSPAIAQTGAILQSGPVTPGHALKAITSGVAGDAGGAAGGPPGTGLTELGVTNPNIGYCQNSAATTATGGYLAFCSGFVNGVPTISENAYGGAAQQPLNAIQNGVTYPLIGSAGANVVGPTSPTPTTGDFVGWNGGTAVSDVGYGPATLTKLNVLQHGAKGDGTTDDTAAIQALLNAGTGPIVLYFPGTAACYKISSALQVPNETVNGLTAKRSVYFKGDGPERSEILQTSATADAIDMSFGTTPPAGNGLWSGGGVSGMTIAAGSSCFAPGINPSTVNSTGTAINIQNGNTGVSVDNVYWKGFGTGLNVDLTWEGYFSRLWGYGQSIGIQIGCNSSFAQGAGNHFSHILLSNDAFNPAVSATAVGIQQCSGGDYFSNIENDSFLHAFVVQPASGQAVEGDDFRGILADTSLGDGFVINGNSGVISAMRFSDSWFGFNNGLGLTIQGTTGNVTGITVTGSHFRENGLAGLGDQISAQLVVTGSDFTGNERGSYALATAGVGCQGGDILTVQGGTLASGNAATTINVTSIATGGSVPLNGFDVAAAGFYTANPTGTVTGGHCSTEPTFTITDPDSYNPGIAVAAGVSGWSFVGNYFGNFATNSTSQAADIAIGSGASSGTYQGNSTWFPAPNSGLAYVVNASTSHINWDQEIYTSSGATAEAAGSTFYLGPAGATTTASGPFLMGGGTITELECSVANAPGTGNTDTFQFYKSGTGIVGVAGTVSGAGFGTGIVPQSYQLSDTNGLFMQGIFSASAAASANSCRFSIAH